MTKEEKDKLIASSDLNREDNIKYISSEAQGIAIALDSDRYAPTLCKLERAYICGRRKSEEQIAELGERCLQLQKDKGNLIDSVRELEAQIEKMKCCGNCKYCKYDQNEESNEYCEKQQQIVNIAVQACGYWEFDNWGK